MAILSSFKAEEREKFIGFVYTANGLGLLIGPLIGAVLYYFGGYCMPFYTFGKFIHFNSFDSLIYSFILFAFIGFLYLILYPFFHQALLLSNSQESSKRKKEDNVPIS